MKKLAFLAVGIICIVAIGSLAFILTQKADFEVFNIRHSPSKVFAGERVTVSVDIKNVGKAEGSYDATLTIEGTNVETKTVRLAPGEEKTIHFTVRLEKEGNYTVKIGDKTLTLTVYPKLFKGAYLEYKVEGIAFIVPVSGTIRLEIIEVTDENYTVSMTPIGIPFLKPETRTYRKGEMALSNLSIEGMEYMGEENISTSLGTRRALHYHQENVTKTGTTKTDYYIDKDTKLPLLMQSKGTGFWVKIEISDTNMEWLKR